MKKLLFLLTICVCCNYPSFSQAQTVIKGTVTDSKKQPLRDINVVLQGTRYGDATNEEGIFSIGPVSSGTYTIVVMGVGLKTEKHTISVGEQSIAVHNFQLTSSSYKMNELVVSGKSKLRMIEDKAFSVEVVNTQQLAATTLELSNALDRVSGVNIRQSGGLGSRTSLAINGFRGKHVKVFINGIPMENFGSAFQLNNIPAGFAKRIEVYKGVVPVGLGADALGGAVNIITNTFSGTHMEASYSYGSFNTRHAYLNGVYVSESGFIARLTAFRNYSDNNYDVEVNIADLETGEYLENTEVERFHDTYHNTTVAAKVGVINTDFADRFLVGITLGHNYDEIQNGARLVSVYGGFHTKGSIVMPSLTYKKDDFLIKNLDFDLSVRYNFGHEQSIDTLHRRYNWLGQYVQYDGVGGERSYSMYKYENNNGIASATFDYAINNRHSLTLSSTFSTFNRQGHDKLNPEQEIYTNPKKTIKNVAGLAYKYGGDDWHASIFVKHYFQNNEYAEPYNPTGDYGDVAYRRRSSTHRFFGYGLATTYFINKNLQLKASYEKSYRLPTAEELFGNTVTLVGNIDLKPEKSNNYNLGASYWLNFDWKHRINISGHLFYRDATNFIRPRLNTNQIMQVMDNLGGVTNLGMSTEIQYSYLDIFTIGANMTYQNLRNNTKYVGGQKSIVYRDRIPNMPYLYGGANASYTFHNLWDKNNDLSIHYNFQYVHSFYLYWPSLGNDNSKFTIPRQLSHDIRLTYSLGLANGSRAQLTLEARNITDNQLYDNFSLPKPGRRFSVKIQYNF